MDKPECSICDNKFDGASHRPRALPCGHGFCTQCIEACIRKGNKSCPICREEHGASSATDLRVSFLLEELLHKATISASKKYKSSDNVQVDGSVIMCPKHQGVPIHFHCKTHQVKACHSCAVIDHPPTSCKLISLDDEIKEMKQNQITNVQQQKQVLIGTENGLKMLLQKNNGELIEQKDKKKCYEKEIEFLFSKIDLVDKDIKSKEILQDKIKDGIKVCQKKKKSFELLESKIKSTTSNQDIVKECKNATTEVMQSQKWDETIRKDLNIIKDKFAQVKRHGVFRSCKILTEGRRTLIPSLSKQIKPPSYAELMQEPELCLTSSTCTVWMDLSACGTTLGRVYIRVMGDRPQGLQFIMLALGTDGPSYKGANFYIKDQDSIRLWQYVTETGERENRVVLNTIQPGYYEIPPRGGVFSFHKDYAQFVIMTKSTTRSYEGNFGQVIAGMDVVDKVYSKDYAIRDIIITECGLVLNY